MGDSLQVIPVLGTDGNRIIKNGKILVQNQSDNALLYVPAEYFADNSTNTFISDGHVDVAREDDQNISYEEVTEEPVIEETDNSEEDSAKFLWSHRSTRSFLTLYLSNRELVQNHRLKSWKALWDKISKEMTNLGFNVGPSQVENKYKSLKRAYKDMLQHNEKVGVVPKHIEFESELEEIFSKKHSKTNRRNQLQNKTAEDLSQNRTTNLNVQDEEQTHSQQIAEEQIIDLTEETSENPVFTWSPCATKLFLELYSTNRERFQNRQLKSLKAMWNKITKELIDAGYDVNPVQVRSKYKSLKRSYKEMVRHNKKTRVEPIHIEFEDELNALFTKKQPVVCPIISGVKGIRIQTSCFGEEQFLPICEPSTSVFNDEIEEDNPAASLNLDDPDMSEIVEENSKIRYPKSVEPTIAKDHDSVIEENTLDNNSRKRKRCDASNTVLQETLDMFRGSAKRKDIFQSEIQELYNKEVQNARNFRRESLSIKNRKLALLKKLLQLERKRTSS